MKYSGLRKLLSEFSRLSKLNAFNLLEYYFPICWNTLDPTFQSISNKNAFKYSVKQHLLERLVDKLKFVRLCIHWSPDCPD